MDGNSVCCRARQFGACKKGLLQYVHTAQTTLWPELGHSNRVFAL